jgi:hypothetical protein
MSPVELKTDSVGYRWQETPEQYAELNSEPMHYPKQYYNASAVKEENSLIYAPLTNMRYINQLLHRPYLGAFMGVGQPSAHNKDTESELLMGLDTRGGPRRACDVLSGVSIDRFFCLPEYGNPQRVQHIVPPWIRGGDNTRDYVRRVNYEAKCLNRKNNRIIHGQLH